MRKVALSFLAHPDDAEFLCAGTMARLAEAGWELHIATATAGDCGTISHDPWQICAIRTKEAKAAADLIGAAYHCLGELDGRVVYDKPTIQKAMDLMRRIAPSLVFTHAPKDYMIDHEQVNLLARAASFMYAAQNVSSLPLISGSAVPHLYYCDPTEGIDPLGQPVTPTTWIDISPQMEKKVQMLLAHQSQRQWLSAHHGLDEFSEMVKQLSAKRGGEIGTAFAEGFIQHRGHAYPRTDLLAELFGPLGQPVNER